MPELNVFLDGEFAGTLEQNSNGLVSFRYDGSYRAGRNSYPISLSMPLNRTEHSGRKVSAYLAGLLPDREDTLVRWGREFGVSHRNPFSLLRFVGRDAAGAVQIVPIGEASDDARDRVGKLTRLADSDVKDILRSLSRNAADWNPGSYGGRWSLAGAQSKIALFRDGEGWAIPEDSTPTTHILKPSTTQFSHHEVNEFVTMRAARKLGLPTARVQLLSFGGSDPVFVTERFDRLNVRGRWIRLHQEDFCQALGRNPDQKYQADGGPGVADIADVISTFTNPRDQHESRRQFFAALAFNVAAGATDAHAKNYSIMLTAGSARLAPLYDLASIFHYEHPQAIASAMKIGDHWRFDQISSKDFRKVANRLLIPEDEAMAILSRINDGIVKAFDDVVQEMLHPELRALGRKLVENLERHSVGRGRPGRSGSTSDL